MASEVKHPRIRGLLSFGVDHGLFDSFWLLISPLIHHPHASIVVLNRGRFGILQPTPGAQCNDRHWVMRVAIVGGGMNGMLEPKAAEGIITSNDLFTQVRPMSNCVFLD